MLVLVAGLVAWLLWPSDSSRGGDAVAEQNLEPFEDAIDDLAASPVVHIRTPQLDVKVTSSGETAGSVSVLGQRFGVLGVDEKLFVKPPKGIIPPGAGEQSGFTFEDRWITGNEGLIGPMLSQTMSPVVLAHWLRSALEQTEHLPAAGDPGIQVGGVTALRAATPVGDLDVTKDTPHRVLRLTPTTAGVMPSRPTLPPLPTFPSLPDFPSLPGFQSPSGLLISNQLSASTFEAAPAWLQQPEAGSESLDISSVAWPEATETYDQIAGDAKQLTNAVDTSVSFTAQGSAAVNCSAGGCSVTSTVTNSASAGNATTSGTVTAAMTAAVSIEGHPAGSCTGSAQLPLNGSGQVSCTAPGAGAVFTQVEAQKRAQALAQSRASGGRPVPYTVTGAAAVNVIATAQINAEKVVRTVEQNRHNAEQGVPTPQADKLRAARPSHFPKEVWDRIADGVAFNEIRRVDYTRRGGGNEIRLVDPKTGKNGKIVDSYIPNKEIVSRKFTQLDKIKPETAISYLRELRNKYKKGSAIADTPQNQAQLPNQVGTKLQGELILEVPPQNGRVPKEIIAEATKLDITIRDSNGKPYN